MTSLFSREMILVSLLLSCLMQIGFGQLELTSPHQIVLDTGWTYRSLDGRYAGPARVPGAIHVDLLANHQIPDPFYRDEAAHLGWIDTTTWIFERRITEHHLIPVTEQVTLVFEGLDTYASIYINGEKILEADNMFRNWQIPLARFRRSDTLEIAVKFEPAILRGKETSERWPLAMPADSDPYPGKPSVFTRKAAYQFGWDFAHPMPGCGLWKPVYLQVKSDMELSGGWMETIRIGEDASDVLVHVTLSSDVEQFVLFKVLVGEQLLKQRVQVLPGQQVFKFPFRITDPHLWWPSREGEPYLYNVNVIAEGESTRDQLLWKGGIRTIQLEQTPDSLGTPFTFIVNGHPVFAAGANWVPADMFPGRIPSTTYRTLLHAAHDAGFNMLRVWGGGIYESDLFYHLTDSLGIMVWQDFMFANCMYPGDDPSFLLNVYQEVTEQLVRLRKHPCIALWCGNNEIDVAWKNWGWQSTYDWSPVDLKMLKRGYDLLFCRLMPELIEDLNSSVSYVHTSPLSNWGDPADLAHGDNHFWGVWHGEMPLDSLQTRIPRFMSEYGMQSFPTWSSIKRFSHPSDWDAHSKVMQLHQRSYKGNGLITKYLQLKGEEVEGIDFKTWVEMGHLLQARAYSVALEAHLDAQPFCMGSLLWQFNEPWPGASWSIIDYYGARKPAYFAVKRIMANRD